MKIEYTNFGLASRVGNIIYLNKRLLKHPELHDALLRHEKAHTSGFSWQDIKIDIINPHLKGVKLKYWAFLLSTPQSWVEVMPIYYKDGNLLLNPLISLIWAFLITLAGIAGLILKI